MMKKSLFLCLVFVIAWSSYAQTAYEQKAAEILQKVEEKYKNVEALRAYFTYEMRNPVHNVYEKTEGVFVMKGDKYRLILPEQEVINNGTTLWTYLKETNEVNISDYEPDESEITPDKIFTLYKRDYKYIWVERIAERGKIYNVIDLQPIDRNKNHFKIRLVINEATHSIKSFEIFEKNQNRYKYTFTRLEFNVAVDDKYFTFNPADYPGVEVVDLR
jgi:outer membrane lipoprotein-sorting protein